MQLPGIVLAALGQLPTLETVEVRDPGPDELHTHTITLVQTPALFAEPRAQGSIRTVIRMGDTA